MASGPWPSLPLSRASQGHWDSNQNHQGSKISHQSNTLGHQGCNLSHQSSKARQGKARQGKARRGEARQGKARRGEARRGEARRGEARRGKSYFWPYLSVRWTVFNGNWTEPIVAVSRCEREGAQGRSTCVAADFCRDLSDHI